MPSRSRRLQTIFLKRPFQGTSASALRLSAPSDSDIPETVRSTNHALRVVFMSDSTIEQGGFLANAVCVEDDAAADSTAFHGCVDHDCLVNRAASATTGRFVAENLDRTPLCCDVTPVAEGNPPCADNNANTAGAEGGAGTCSNFCCGGDYLCTIDGAPDSAANGHGTTRVSCGTANTTAITCPSAAVQACEMRYSRECDGAADEVI